jgi:hypothetical protein
MKSSESIKQITKSIIEVMKEVKGIDKSMTVGSGNNSYKGVSDQDVKKEIGKSMEKYGLCLIPTEVEPTLQIDRWDEIDQYAKIQGATKQKQSVFTSVKTKYILLHESGEWIEVSGYGHGVDSQDKAAGKATTYALKYALLYMFMVPTGKIDDADANHSDETQIPKNGKAVTSYNHAEIKKNNLPVLGNKGLKEAVERINKGELQVYYKVIAEFSLEKTQEQALKTAFDNSKAKKNEPAIN